MDRKCGGGEEVEMCGMEVGGDDVWVCMEVEGGVCVGCVCMCMEVDCVSVYGGGMCVCMYTEVLI